MIVKLVGGPADGRTFDPGDLRLFEVSYPLRAAHLPVGALPGDPLFGRALYEVKRVICEDRTQVIFAIPANETVESALRHLLATHWPNAELRDAAPKL